MACVSSQGISEKNNPLNLNIEPMSHLGDVDLIINDTHVAVGVSPHSLRNFEPGVNIYQFGLVGLLTQLAILNGENSSIHEQQKLLHPIRNSIINYNYGSKLRAGIETQLTQLKWLKINYVGKYPDLQKNNSVELLKNNEEDNLVIIDSSYSFSEKFDSLSVICFVAMHSKQKLENISKVKADADFVSNVDSRLIYQNKFNYTYNLDGVNHDKLVALKMWSENDGALLTKAFDVALDTISKNISDDMRDKKYKN